MNARYRVERIPDELKAIPRWCGFQIVRQTGGKTKKTPLVSGVTGRVLAKCNDVSTLRPFELALRDAELRGLYLAFAFDADLPYFFIDADDVVTPDGDDIRQDIVQVRDALDTYTEISASGTGLHIIGRGKFRPNAGNVRAPEGHKPLERYPLHGGRFCVLTGDVLPGYETLRDREEALSALFPEQALSSNGNGAYHGTGGDLLQSEGEAIVRWAKPHWTDGRRHPMALHLSGYLGKQGVSRDQAVRIIERCATNDDDPGAKVHACHDSYDALEAGGSVSGWHGLREVGISESDLAPLDAVLSAFWRRNHPRVETIAPDPTDAPAFPVEVLPDAMRVYVEQVSASFPVPHEMIAVPLLAGAASVIGNRVHLELYPSWREYPTLWFVMVASSGSAKTPALNAALWPVRKLQDDAKDRYDQEMSWYADAMAAHKATPAKERGAEPRHPKMRDYFTTDVTMEALADILERDPGVLIQGDEIAGWVERMDQYRKGGDRQHYMSIHSGVPIKVNRKGSGFVYARQPVACVVGGIQPTVVPKLRGTDNVDDGFLYRVLPMVPALQPKRWNRHPGGDVSFKEIAAFFRRLDAIERTQTEDGRVGMAVRLSAGAEDDWELFMNDNSAKAMHYGGMLGGFYAKLEAQVARLTLVLHVLANPDDPRRMISAETMEDGIELGEWFRHQIDLFVPLMGLGVNPSGVSGGLRPRIYRQLKKARLVETETVSSDNSYQQKVRLLDSSTGWVSHSDLLRGLKGVKTEELTNELDTCSDLGEIDRRQIVSPTKPGWEYRIVLDSDRSRVEQSNNLTISDSDVPWEEA